MNKPIKIVYIVTTVDGFGADKSILENIFYLKCKGLIDPIVIIPCGGLIEDALSKQGVAYHVIPFKSWFCGPTWFFGNVVKRSVKAGLNNFLSYWTSHLLRANGAIDIVHTNTFTTDFGMQLARKLNAQHVMHIRELPLQQFSFEYEFGQERTCHYADEHSALVFANSEYVKNSFRSLWKKNIQVLNNPVDGNERLENPNSYEFSNGINLIAMGRFHEDKQHMTAIDAAAILHKEGLVGFKLYIYGEGALRAALENKIRASHLTDVVSLLPYRGDLHSILHKFQIGLITSRCEAFGRATVEYMGAGLAVIGNETGNTPFLVENEKSGLIAQFGNADDLAKCIKRLLLNTNDITLFGRAAFQKVSGQFTVDSSSRKLYQAYQDVL